MSRAVIYESFGGPEVLELREVPEPHAGPGEVRVRVAAAGLNPMDGGIFLEGDVAARFGISLPSGFGSDFAGVVDEVGAAATGFAVGDRVYGGAMGRAVADFLVVRTPGDRARMPSSIRRTASATRWRPRACGGHTSSQLWQRSTCDRRYRPDGRGRWRRRRVRRATRQARRGGGDRDSLGGHLRVPAAARGPARGLRPGLADRVRALAPQGGVSAATDLFGTETVEAALALGVPPERISTIHGWAQPSWRRARHRGQRSRDRCLGSDHRRDPRWAKSQYPSLRPSRSRRGDPCRRDTPGRTPRPRQDRGHSLTAPR